MIEKLESNENSDYYLFKILRALVAASVLTRISSRVFIRIYVCVSAYPTRTIRGLANSSRTLRGPTYGIDSRDSSAVGVLGVRFQSLDACLRRDETRLFPKPSSHAERAVGNAAAAALSLERGLRDARGQTRERLWSFGFSRETVGESARDAFCPTLGLELAYVDLNCRHILPLTNCAFNKCGDKFITGHTPPVSRVCKQSNEWSRLLGSHKWTHSPRLVSLGCVGIFWICIFCLSRARLGTRVYADALSSRSRDSRRLRDTCARGHAREREREGERRVPLREAFGFLRESLSREGCDACGLEATTWRGSTNTSLEKTADDVFFGCFRA